MEREGGGGEGTVGTGLDEESLPWKGDLLMSLYGEPLGRHSKHSPPMMMMMMMKKRDE